MATKAEIVAELKTYSEYSDVKETVLMRELKASLEAKLAAVKGISTDELKKVEKPVKKTTARKTTSKKAKIDFEDPELDADLLNADSVVNEFYGEYEDILDDDFDM